MRCFCQRTHDAFFQSMARDGSPAAGQCLRILAAPCILHRQHSPELSRVTHSGVFLWYPGVMAAWQNLSGRACDDQLRAVNVNQKHRPLLLVLVEEKLFLRGMLMPILQLSMKALPASGNPLHFEQLTLCHRTSAAQKLRSKASKHFARPAHCIGAWQGSQTPEPRPPPAETSATPGEASGLSGSHRAFTSSQPFHILQPAQSTS